jgi:hypothetical protein
MLHSGFGGLTRIKAEKKEKRKRYSAPEHQISLWVRKILIHIWDKSKTGVAPQMIKQIQISRNVFS